jgi:uncharacterized membrane protein YqaE (UPF0057 family)
MKEINKILLTSSFIILFSFLLSCNTEKSGVAHNNKSSHFDVKENPLEHNNSLSVLPDNCADNMEASVEKAPDLTSESPKEITIVPKPAPMIRHTSKPEVKAPEKKVENKVENIPSEPSKKLSKEEKKEIKQILKDSDVNRKNVVGKVLLVIFSIILPPLAVALVDGFTGPFWLDLLLTILFYLPGLIYALYRVLRTS